jgi:predicted trehalose synthase
MTEQSPQALLALLDRWVPAQRWFGGKGTSGELTLTGTLDLPGPDGSDDSAGPANSPGSANSASSVGSASSDGAVVQLHVVSAATTRGEVTTHQVPLVFRPHEQPDQAAGLVGVLDGATYVYDGAHDPEFVRRWLRLIDEQGSVSTPGGPSAQGRRQPGGVPVPVDGRARVLSGEQSNTSVIVEGTPPVIIKLFRTLYGGANPDVVVQSALAAAGSTRVPAPSGWIEGSWTRADGSAVSGHLAFASEFLVGTRDAWREASESLAQGVHFGPQAYTLGQATAEVHRTLAEELATEAASPARRSELVHALRVRAAWACEQVADLTGLDAPLRDIHHQLDELVDFPVLQRIHGDYHLGQVLDAPGRGWVLLDFEGEPLRPISERSDPDLALRDVAGMLRSFDYAAHQAEAGRLAPTEAQAWGQEWAGRCREEFCLGYADVAGHDPREYAALLVALELDKALYEVVYEARNRPDWIDVPLRAVARLTGS